MKRLIHLAILSLCGYVTASTPTPTQPAQTAAADEYIVSFLKMQDKKTSEYLNYDAQTGALTLRARQGYGEIALYGSVAAVLSLIALCGYFEKARQGHEISPFTRAAVVAILGLPAFWCARKALDMFFNRDNKDPYVTLDKAGICDNEHGIKVSWKELDRSEYFRVIALIDRNEIRLFDVYRNVLSRITDEKLPVSFENFIALFEHYWQEYYKELEIAKAAQAAA